MSFMTFVKKLDFLAPLMGFENEESNKFRTIPGALISMATFTAALIIAILFGQEVYQRKNPNVSESREFIEDSKIYFNDFPPLFTFHYGDTREVDNPNDFYDFWLESIHFDKDSKIEKRYNYSMIECRTKNITNKVVENQLNTTSYNYFCLNNTKDEYFSNEMASPNSIYYRIMFELCNSNDSSRNCKASQQSITSTGLVVVMSYVNTFVDSTRQDNPVVPYIERFVQTLSWGVTKIFYFQIKNNLYISDNGWMLEDKNNINYINVDGYRTDMNVLNFSIRKLVFAAVFESPRLRVKTQRNYLKVQELFARVGGIANAFSILMTLVFQDYIRFLYLAFINKHAFEKFNNNTRKNIIENNYNYSSNKKFDGVDNVNNKPNLNFIDNNSLNLKDSQFMLKGFNKSNLISSLKQNSIQDELKGSKQIVDQAVVYRKIDEEKDKDNKRHESNPQISSILVSNVENNKLFKTSNAIKDSDKIINKEYNLCELFEENLASNNVKELKYHTYLLVRYFKCLYNQETISGYAIKIKKIKKLIDVKLLNYFLLDQYYNYYKK